MDRPQGGLSPPRIPALGRRSGRFPALPYPPPRCKQYTAARGGKENSLPAKGPAEYNWICPGLPSVGRYSLTQLSAANNLFLTFAVTALGFCVSLVLVRTGWTGGLG